MTVRDDDLYKVGRHTFVTYLVVSNDTIDIGRDNFDAAKGCFSLIFDIFK